MIHGYKTVSFKVFASDHKRFERFRFDAPKGDTFTSSGVQVLKKFLHVQLLQQFPEARFNFIPIKANVFNVVHKLGHA